MASTLNLYALDVDTPTSRQLNIKREDGENKLLVKDNSTLTKLDEIKNAMLSLTPTMYTPEDLFDGITFTASGDADTNDTSKLCDVARVQKVNIHYEDLRDDDEDGIVNDGHVVVVMGRIGGGYKALENGSGATVEEQESFVEAYVNGNGEGDLTSYDVELFRFYPRTASDKNTFNVIDLNVNGITKVYLKTEETNTLTSAKAYVSSQF